MDRNVQSDRLEVAIDLNGARARKRNLCSVSCGGPFLEGGEKLGIPILLHTYQRLTLSPIGALVLLEVLKTPPPTAFVMPTPKPVIAPMIRMAIKTFTQNFCLLLIRWKGLYELWPLLLTMSSCCFRTLLDGHTASSAKQRRGGSGGVYVVTREPFSRSCS